MGELTYRRAKPSDTRPILALIQHYSAKGLMLPRSYSQVVERIRDFVVADPADPSSPGLAGVVGLHVVGEDLAEIRSLAVDERRIRQGIGRKLVEECLREAAQMGLPKVFALTYRTEFFERSGFQVVEKNVLPQKIWGDCVHCAKFSDCDEIAMVKNVRF